MTIDPRWSLAVAGFLALLNYTAGIGGLLTDTGLDPSFVKHFIAWVNIFGGALASLNFILTGIPAKDNTTGFIVKGPPKQ